MWDGAHGRMRPSAAPSLSWSAPQCEPGEDFQKVLRLTGVGNGQVTKGMSSASRSRWHILVRTHAIACSYIIHAAAIFLAQ